MPQLSHPDQLSCNGNHGWEMFRVTHSSPFFPHHSALWMLLSARTSGTPVNSFFKERNYISEEMIY